MSIQWTIIATFLYFEIGLVFFLTLPVISPQRWSKLFKSKFLKAIGAQASLYFYILLGILILFFLDAIREMRKYSEEDQQVHAHSHLDAEMQNTMKLFRAQRNFYISGFSLFLSLVIRRLVVLISAQASLMAQSEASLKQATSATQAARAAMQLDGKKGDSGSGDSKQNGGLEKEVKHLKGLLEDAEIENKKLKKNVDSMKSQASSVSTEYDRLLAEHDKLQREVDILKGSSGSKKDE